MIDLRTDEQLRVGIAEYESEVHRYSGGDVIAMKLRRELERREKVWDDVNRGRAARTSPSGLWR